MLPCDPLKSNLDNLDGHFSQRADFSASVAARLPSAHDRSSRRITVNDFTTMINATKNWLRRNRTNFAIGFGVLGVGYVAGQYVLSKIAEAGERMSNERIAKEDLRRRFQQNQEDCSITVQALLPTATEDIVEALPVENITHELQAKKAERLGRISAAPDVVATDHSSGPASVTDEDGKSLVSFQSESYVHASQLGEASPKTSDQTIPSSAKSKIQLWNDVKIYSITRSFTLLYTLCLLTLLTRIQLNLLGRRNYLSSVILSASHSTQDPRISLENRDDDNLEQNYGGEFEINRKFLTFSWWLLHRGWRNIQEKVQAAVIEIFGPLNPREEIEPDRFSDLTLAVRRSVEGATPEERRNRTWLPYVLPPPDQEEFVLQESGIYTAPGVPNSTTSPTTLPRPSAPSAPTTQPTSSTAPSLRRLLDETADLIESPPFSQILTQILDALFSHLIDHHLRTQAFKLPLGPLPIEALQLPPSSTATLIAPDLSKLPPRKVKLANILAPITRQAHVIGSGMPNEYVQVIDSIPDLEAFAAVVCSSNYELEIVRDPSEPGASASASYSEAYEGRTPAPAPAPTPTPSSSSSTRRGEERAQSAEGQQRRESEKGAAGSSIFGIPDQAAGLFENVWGKVVGQDRTG